MPDNVAFQLLPAQLLAAMLGAAGLVARARCMNFCPAFSVQG